MDTAKYIADTTVTDPDSNAPVEVGIYKDPRSGGMFGVDSSYVLALDQPIITEPFNGRQIMLDETGAAPKNQNQVELVTLDSKRGFEAVLLNSVCILSVNADNQDSIDAEYVAMNIAEGLSCNGMPHTLIRSHALRPQDISDDFTNEDVLGFPRLSPATYTPLNATPIAAITVYPVRVTNTINNDGSRQVVERVLDDSPIDYYSVYRQDTEGLDECVGDFLDADAALRYAAGYADEAKVEMIDYTKPQTNANWEAAPGF